MAQGAAKPSRCRMSGVLAEWARKQDHNRRCLELLEPLIHNDKRAMRYLRREAERGIGIAGAVPGGITIDWD